MTDIQENIAAVVIGAVTLSVLLVLTGCTKSVPTDSVLESVKEQTVALEKTLSAECKTDAVLAQIAAIRTQTNAVSLVCKSEKDALKQERDKWAFGFVVLGLLLGFSIIRKVLKYV